jgi:hypothetical protein
MNASRPDAVSRTRARLVAAARACALVAGALCVLAGAGCHTTTPTSGFEILEPTASEQPRPPTPLDRAVADLTAAALAGTRPEMDAALSRIETLHDEKAMREARVEGRPAMTGLVPLCLDLRNSTLGDPVAYRTASKELLRSSHDLDPALKARLEQAVADDPLKLASARTWDHYESLWATSFNAVVEPIGGSLVWGLALAPFQLATRLTHYAAEMYSRPPISLQERQALAHRKQYLAEYPEAADATKVRKKVEKGQRELDAMQAEHFAKQAQSALAGGQYWIAELQADRALRIEPDEQGAATAMAGAAWRRARLDALREQADRASPELPQDLVPEAVAGLPTRDGQPPLAGLLERLLATSNLGQTDFAPGAPDPERRDREEARLLRLVDELRILQQSDPDGPLADEIEYLLALTQRDLGFEDESWRKLSVAARADPLASNMQRHARALVDDPLQNAYGSFSRQRTRADEKAVGFRLFGAHALGRSYPDLPLGLSYLVELPSIAQALVLAPLRLFFGPWDPPNQDFDQAPAAAGYRYLGREPAGEHTREVASWLYAHETKRENWVAALPLYDLLPESNPDERLVLTEKAADQQLAAAERAARRDWRGSILRGLVREFPDSDSGLQAGLQLRQEFELISPQRIRMTKGFLQENPSIAGPHALALNPALLDGKLRNGELHPQGVSFLGARVMEFALVAESGDEEAPPVSVREQVSQERLSRTVAMLDETMLLNAQVDDGEPVRPDAERDYYLERARLGLVGEPDLRASAESTYVYESLREQYGMVRGRDSVLPFDLVFQGSLFDMSLGAFPRWRQPKQTPDAFLYR